MDTMHTRLLALLGLALLGMAGTAAAADDVGKWYLAPQVYQVWTGGDRQVGDHSAVSLAIGKHISDKWSVEAAVNHGRFSAQSPADDLRITAFSVDALRHFYRDSKIHPFLSIGIVESNERRDSIKRYDRQMIQAGLGVLANLYSTTDRSRVLQLRAEAKNRWHVSWITDPNQGEPSDFLAGIGLQFNWGAPIAAPAPVREEPPAPAAAPTAAPEPPKDSDGDGVPDTLDKCPATPAGVKVDGSGCPLDSDRDGVADYLDKCPGTPAGIKVDANGCEIEEIVLKGVNFDFDSAKLTPASEQVLDEVVALLRLRPGASATLGGHTDGKGKAGYNLKLSERRATAVRDYLVAKGIPAGSLTATGYGATRPIAPNTTDEGRAQNRRVTLEFAKLATR